MNCKEGDLARVVMARETPELIGRYVIVESAANPGEKIDGVRWEETAPGGTWVIRSASGSLLPWRMLRSHETKLVQRRAIADICLRPIRDPGPDEVDEMVKLLGAPSERTPVLVGMGGEA